MAEWITNMCELFYIFRSLSKKLAKENYLRMIIHAWMILVQLSIAHLKLYLSMKLQLLIPWDQRGHQRGLGLGVQTMGIQGLTIWYLLITFIVILLGFFFHCCFNQLWCMTILIRQCPCQDWHTLSLCFLILNAISLNFILLLFSYLISVIQY